MQNIIFVLATLIVRSVFLITVLFIFFNTTLGFTSVIKEDKNSYFVRNVRAEGASFENEQSTKQIALLQAKQTALQDLLYYIKAKDVSFDEANINAMVSSYAIEDEYYNENFYALIANFTFDKAILQSFLSAYKSRKDSRDRDEVDDYIIKLQEKDDIISEYMMLKKFLKKQKIKFTLREIEATEISVLVEKVNKGKIYDSLRNLGINGKIYVD